jgi:hypothetical protein
MDYSPVLLDSTNNMDLTVYHICLLYNLNSILYRHFNLVYICLTRIIFV